MRPLVLRRPHAYLIWKGRKTAVVSDKPLNPDEKMVIICDNEAYGEVILKQPVTTKITGFEMMQEEHCIKPEERRLWWPDVENFYMYRFSELQLYNQMLPATIKNGEVQIKGIPKLDKEEVVLVDRAGGLPSQILLNRDVVSLNTKGQASCDKCVPEEIIKPLLRAVYEREFKLESIKGTTLPIYDLCLVKSPRIIIHKKSKEDITGYTESDEPIKVCSTCIFNSDGFCEVYNFKWDSSYICNDWEPNEAISEELAQRGISNENNREYLGKQEANMPYEIVTDEEKACVKKVDGEIIECYSFEEFEEEVALDKADKLLTALRINVEGEESAGESKGIQLILEEIGGQFRAKFYPPDSQSWGYVLDVSEDEDWLIVEEDGVRYKVGLSKTESGYQFTERDSWTKVETIYNEVGGAEPEEEQPELELEPGMEESEDEKQFDDSDWDGAASNWDTADAYCSDSLIDVNPAGEDKTKALCFLPYRRPGASNPNRNALQAIAGGRGITAVEKPADVSGDDWDSELQAAADKLIDWWPEAFDKPAPDSIYEIAGKEPPEQREEKAGRRLKKDWIQRIKDIVPILKELIGWAEYQDMEKNILDKGFAIKSVNGAPWFFTWSSSGFRDRDKEIVTTSALETYVKEAETKDKGYFNVWHIPGTDFAQIKWQVVAGRILMEAGPFLNSSIGKKAKEFFGKYPDSHPELAPEGWGASIEFRFLPEELETGEYSWIWKTRTSVLAKSVASNTVTKGAIMKLDELNPDQLKIGMELFGSETELQQALDEAVKTSKDKEEVVGPENYKSTDGEDDTETETEKEDETPEEPEENPVPVMEVLVEKAGALLISKLQEELKVVNEIPSVIEELGNRILALETNAKVKNVNSTRFSLFTKAVEQRASEAEGNIVPEEDDLAKAGPNESVAKRGGGAAHFFDREK